MKEGERGGVRVKAGVRQRKRERVPGKESEREREEKSVFPSFL